MKTVKNFFKKIFTFLKEREDVLFHPLAFVLFGLCACLVLCLKLMFFPSPEERQYFREQYEARLQCFEDERTYRVARQQAFSLQASIKENSIKKIPDNPSNITFRIYHCDSTGERRYNIPSDLIMPYSKNNSIKTFVGDKFLEYVAYLPNGVVIKCNVPIEEKSIANSSLSPDPTGKE